MAVTYATQDSLVAVDDLRAALDVPATLVDDQTLQGVCDAATAALVPHLKPEEDHSLHATDREAALTIAVHVWQSRHAPGGQMVGVDLAPQITPHLLGPGLIMRVQGLVSECLPYGGAVVA
jgi:hypothetical protein